METVRLKEIEWLFKVTHPCRVTESNLDTGNVTLESTVYHMTQSTQEPGSPALKVAEFENG